MDRRGHTNRSWEGLSTSKDDQEEDAESSDVIVGELDVHWGGGRRVSWQSRGSLERPTDLSLLQYSSPGCALSVAFVLARFSLLRRVPSSRSRVQCSKKPTLLKSQVKTSVGHLRRQENQVRREARRRGFRSRGCGRGTHDMSDDWTACSLGPVKKLGECRETLRSSVKICRELVPVARFVQGEQTL